MQSHEALAVAIDHKTIEHAKRQRKCSSLVHKWQEPHTDFTDSGTTNPLDRIELIIETSLSLGTSPDKALAPVHYLAERFGLVVLSVPCDKTTVHSCEKELLRVIEEFGELARESSHALADGKIRRKESESIETEGWETIRQIARFIKRAQEAVK